MKTEFETLLWSERICLLEKRLTEPTLLEMEVCHFSAPYSGGVERHQQRAMVGSQSCVDESCDFFLAENRW